MSSFGIKALMLAQASSSLPALKSVRAFCQRSCGLNAAAGVEVSGSGRDLRGGGVAVVWMLLSNWGNRFFCSRSSSCVISCISKVAVATERAKIGKIGPGLLAFVCTTQVGSGFSNPGPWKVNVWLPI